MEAKLTSEIISEKDCYRIIEQHLGENNFHVLKYEFCRADSKIMGYMGEHFRLKINYQKGPNSKISTDTFFVKTEPLSNETQAKYVGDMGLFKKESMLYENVLSRLTAIAGSHFCPKCYLVKKNCMVFEDLSRENYKVKEGFLNLEECEALVKCLATFHSASIIYEEINSNEKKQLRMDEVYKEEIEEKAFSYVEGQPRNMWLKNNTNCVSDCIKFRMKLKDSEKIVEKLRRIALQDMKSYIRASNKFRNVITHCDLWTNNFMINDELKCKLVDFQLARYSPPAYDLMLTLFLNTDNNLLKKHLGYLLDLYYTTFEGMLNRYHLPAKKIFPKKLFFESIQYYKLPTLLEAVYFTTNTQISAETTSYVLEDAARYHEFAFTNRSKYILEEYDKNEVFRKAFLELAIPLVELLREENCFLVGIHLTEKTSKIFVYRMDRKADIITEDDCYKILKSSSQTDKHLVKYSLSQSKDEAVGFLGDYFHLTLFFKTDDDFQLKEQVYFLKTEPISNENQRSFVQECGLFKKEAFLYKNIFPGLIKSVGFNFAPCCFMVKENLLVLEDLKKRNFKIVQRDYTLEECKSLLRTLAYFHSSSIVYEEKTIKSEKEFSLDRHMDKLPEGTFSFKEGDSKYNWLKCISSCLVDLMKTMPGYDKKIELKFREMIFGGDMEKFISPSKKFRNVLTHNDLWSSNIFLDSKHKECLFVDFQMVRYTPPAYDLIMALFLNNSIEFLEKYLDSLLTFYYQTFSDILRDHQLDNEAVFPLNVFLESIEIYKIPALIEATMFATTVYLPEERGAYIREDSERYHNYTFVNKTPYIMDTFLKDIKYRKKVLGLLITLIEVLQKKSDEFSDIGC
ncbi:uncharacterized protein LOC123685391 [Harmonia axyridis]|uniref:uncharacterized protein LOC123685391 n=1 Tax=Harmonia axyridis TaxID=115357 RepID=UPI001E276E53|nr:uncharacterized protein LOC123685391 [Harmonia axyridis]